jgi:hypothetical protein
MAQANHIVPPHIRSSLAYQLEKDAMERVVKVKYADQLARASFWGRQKLKREIRKEVQIELKKKFPNGPEDLLSDKQQRKVLDRI